MKSMFGMCFNWKVLVGLAAVGVGLFIVAPGYAAAALPLLLLAACPLSMVGMMFAMKRMGSNEHADGELPAKTPEAMREQLASLQAEETRLEREISESEARDAEQPQPAQPASASHRIAS